MKIRNRLVGCAFGLLVTLPAMAQAATVFTEDFTGGTYRTSNVPGWTVTGDVLVLDSAAYVADAGGFNSTGTGQFLAFGAGDQPDNGVATTPEIPVTSGKSYTIAFDYGSFSGNPSSTQSIAVLVNGDLLKTFTTTSSTNNLADVLGPESATFTGPASGEVTIGFEDTSSNTYSVDGLLDNVSVSSVPEPATWALMLIGFAGLGAALRRTRQGPDFVAA